MWFVKEKKLIPGEAFNVDYISDVVKRFDSDGALSEMGQTDEGNYYKAILQNLFFATLNTPMDKDPAAKDERRQFLDESKNKNGYNDQHLDQTKYRHNNLLKKPEILLKLFKDVPFLNGGLFECLDYRELDGSEKRYDGFSSTKSKQPLVPDVLFFSPQNEEDLSADFDNDNRMKGVRIRGLIHILDSYKFTIAENTPLEEEIALDPELLGKVFENLLASYNPETKTTARKQTGSFYTPREIVNYMVDESLKAYLVQKLMEKPVAFLETGRAQSDMFGNNHRKGQLKLETPVTANDDKQQQQYQQALEKLFDNAHSENTFSADETHLLIEALSNCRILDPACGSGAFPMGILHRMVTLLKQLDPNNKAWKEAQLNKAKNDLKKANEMQDATIKEAATQQAEQRIEYIKESFENPRHELDYTRKLFLVENCIYGVDIQQIAVQIAKLRFFISLMSEQQVDDNRPNRNILSMPNLETKFVAANTLIALEKNVSSKKGSIGTMEFRSEAVEKIERRLKDLRKQIFFTRSYRQKKKLKLEEKALREELKTALVQSSWGEQSAAQAAEWDPFDQLHSAPFYDTETMFGFTEGFDIVIGNPPYLFGGNEGISLKDKEYYKKEFISGSGKINLFTIFIEKGFQLLGVKSHIAYIIPNTFLRVTSYHEARKYLIDNYVLKNISDFGANVFESATTTAIVLVAKKESPKAEHLIKISQSFIEGNYIKQEILKNNDYVIATNVNDLIQKIIDVIKKETVELGTLCKELIFGVVITKNHSEVVSETYKKGWKPFLEGRDISRYLIKPITKYLNYEPNLLHRSRTKEIFEVNEKLLIQRISGGSTPLKVAYDDKQLYNKESINNLILTNDRSVDIKYILALLNSKLLNWFYNFQFTNESTLTVNISKEYLSRIPIKMIAKTLQQPFITLVDKIIQFKENGKDTTALEAKIDQMVYALYNLTYDEACMIEGNTEWRAKEEYEKLVEEMVV